MKRLHGLRLLPIIILCAAIGIAASFIVDQDAIKSKFSSDVFRIIVKTAALVLAASPGIVSFARAEHRAAQALLAQNAQKGIADLEDILVSAISILFDGEPGNHIRANVMLVIGDRLKMFSNANMKAFPDHQMELGKGQGCAGVAWERAMTDPVSEYWKPVYAPKTKLTNRHLRTLWRLSAEQMKSTQHILWVLSIPLIGNLKGKREFLGVLNFDGVIAGLRHPEVFMDTKFMGNCVRMGERVADHLVKECRLLLERLDRRFTGL